MAAKQAEASNKSSNKIRVVAHVLATYHLVLSIILLIEYSVELARRKSCCLEISNYIRLDIISSYLLLVVLLLISISFLYGIIVNRRYLVMPFLALQTMDLILSFVMFGSVYSNMSPDQAYVTGSMVNVHPDTQDTVQKVCEMCLRLMTYSSCFVEVRNYIDLKATSYLSYLSEINLPSQKYTTRLIIFTLLHAAVILYKALMISCVWKVFVSLNLLPKKKDMSQQHEFTKVALPSYEEAVKTTSKDSPPPYSTV
ncbi:lysosomal-associated transmembrane protein 5 [Pyxicephalus adspersus]|uniref:lysosomal-associated transmembrane protein 5 n=1 Tax=Pyxicephalus adspersus TaxID=30357 RepID=UPI003B597E75